MAYETLILDINENIAVLTINRPASLNAINQKMMSELHHFFTEEVYNLPVKGVIITGQGEKSFIAGADISEFLNKDLEDKNIADKGHNVFFAIERCSKPVIAAINGYALGGGCELAMACHMRIASEKAILGLPELNLGLIPGYGGTQRLPQLVGKGKATELILTGEAINANYALQIGLVNKVVKPGNEVDAAIELLKIIFEKGPLAVTMAIDSINAYYDQNRNGYQQEVENFVSLTKTKDFIEGATAFLEKRKPNFEGQ